jgi:hypothetical protein
VRPFAVRTCARHAIAVPRHLSPLPSPRVSLPHSSSSSSSAQRAAGAGSAGVVATAAARSAGTAGTLAPPAWPSVCFLNTAHNPRPPQNNTPSARSVHRRAEDLAGSVSGAALRQLVVSQSTAVPAG